MMTKYVISQAEYDQLVSLREGKSIGREIHVGKIARMVTITRTSGRLIADCSVNFSGNTAGVTWFAPMPYTFANPELVVGKFFDNYHDGTYAGYYFQPVRGPMQIGEIGTCEAEDFA